MPIFDDAKNRVILSGVLVTQPTLGHTHAGAPAATAMLTAHSHHSIRIRVNAYDDLAHRLCELSIGDHVSVDGELYSRRGRSGETLEIRANRVKLMTTPRETSRAD